MSDVLILASINPQKEDRLLCNWITNSWKLQAQHMLCMYIKLFWMSKQKQIWFTKHVITELVVFLYCTPNSSNNLSSYFGLIDARMSASDKNLPVITTDNVLKLSLFPFEVVEVKGRSRGRVLTFWPENVRQPSVWHKAMM